MSGSRICDVAMGLAGASLLAFVAVPMLGTEPDKQSTGAAHLDSPSTEGSPASEGAGVAAPTTDGKGGDADAKFLPAELGLETSPEDMTTPRPADSTSARRGYRDIELLWHNRLVDLLSDNDGFYHDHRKDRCSLGVNGRQLNWIKEGETWKPID